MTKYIVSGVIVVLCWILALLFDFPLYIPLLITLVVGLVLVLLVGIGLLRERRGARKLEQALGASAQQQASSARPDLQHEIAEMQAEFQKAVAALKTTKKGGKKALYSLPWYAIIGPPGCGKSTALRNSGLQFPYLSASGGGVRGLGGTRNCDWWMTSEGVILDTAGRWTSEDEDHDEWLGFLDLIKRFRPKKPINGIIAAVSIGDVGGAREDEVVQLARRIRERIDEVQARLEMSIPVYVLLTKCDLIPGFVETFGDMVKQERGQIWGFTAPLTKNIGPPAEYFRKGFDELVGVLEHRSVKRMGDERKISNRELIHAFPQQLEVLRSNLTEFVHNLFVENVFKETPLLRGVYFTSGTQEGRPIDRVMSKMAEAFGQPQVQLPAPQVEVKSYFLRDMFSEVVFKDADVAVRSPEELKRQRIRMIAAAAAIFLLALGIGGLPAIAWAGNRSYLEDTREMIDNTRRAVREESDEPIAAEAIEALRARAVEMGEYEDDGAPLMMQMGMYQDEVYEPVRGVYLDALRRRVVAPLFRADLSEMQAFLQRIAALGPSAHPQAAEMRQMYDRLKLHILLTVPREEHQPPLDDDQRDFIVSELRARWRKATDVQRHDRQYAMMEENLRYYANMLADHPELHFPRSADATAGVRGVFRALGGFEMAVQGIVIEVETEHRMQDMTLTRLVGHETQWLRARGRVRAAFTKQAWDEHVQTMLAEDAQRFFGEHWVLGNPPPENERVAQVMREQQVADLRSYFLEAHVREWQGFIDSLWIAVPEGDQEHMSQLTELTSGEPQLLTTLIRGVDYNVTLEQPEAAVSASVAARRAQRLAQRRVATRIGSVFGATGQEVGTLSGAGLTRAQREAQARGLTAGAPDPLTMTALRVPEMFRGFIDFAPREQTDVPDGQAAQITSARRYEEQLEFLRDALGFRMSGTNVTDFDERQGQARSLTTTLISERPEGWQERFRTLLMAPIEGPAWVPPEPPTTATGGAPTRAPTPAPTAGPEPTLIDEPVPTLPAVEPAPATMEATPRPRRRSRAWWNNP